ncbi:extracellular solute-binding protein [Bianquea renquensis]|jgi:extracellular solute-binding protein family 1|uniref:Extracellular solute-binding protein n=1 Tax=Bianquea renquensis TaxID=2763661 RepID=A0A926DSK1_9FIRM|nr:extracellular solute-binding protein [Bianquea renquensis]MBC8542549.1 extracellular solute-binding protein [Bianquea renquensis]
MKKFVKTVAIVLSLTMTLTALAACSNSKENDSSSSSSANNSSTVSSNSTVEEDKVHTLKILGPDPGNQYIKFSEREEYKVWGLLQDMLKENNLELELEAVPNDQYEVVIQTRMASTSLPDIANLTPIDDASILTLGKNGTIQELSELIQKYSNGNIDRMFGEVYDTAYPLITTAEGKIYWLTDLHKGSTYGGKEIPVGLGMQIRQDWLDKVNAKMPTTLAEFTDVLRTFREQDVNGNGKQDEIILVDAQYFNNGLAQIFGLGNGYVALDVINGKIVSPWYQDNIKEYFTYLNGLVNEGLIDSATLGSWDIQNQRLADNLVASWNAYDSATYLNGYVTSDSSANYVPVFTLTDAVEGSEPWKEVETSQLVWQRYCITKACTDVEGAIKFFDMIYSDEYMTILHWGVEGETYEVRDGVNYSINIGTNEDKANARKTNGSPLWGDLLPRVQLGSAYKTYDEWEEVLKGENRSDVQIQAMAKAVDYEYWYPLMLDNFLAMPTDEETESLNKILTGIQTYSDEMCMKITLGTASLDDFDTYLGELKELGLDELIAIQQARYDRFVAASK